MDDLLNEMNTMSADLTLQPAKKSNTTAPPFSTGYKVQQLKPLYSSSSSSAAPLAPKRAAPPKRKNSPAKHATHGAAPMELMTQFLVLVSSGKMQEALDIGQQILVFEPDNPLIKMYQEAMIEYLALGIGENQESSDDEDGDDEFDGQGDDQGDGDDDGDNDDDGDDSNGDDDNSDTDSDTGDVIRNSDDRGGWSEIKQSSGRDAKDDGSLDYFTRK